jgi:putative hydrolase
MLTVDLHSHTLFSKCGMFTYMDLLTRAKELGVEMLAITDHGSGVGGSIPGTFFERMGQPLSEVTLLKGVECNVLDGTGRIDLPQTRHEWIDIVLLGLHKNLPVKMSRSTCTNFLVHAIEKNPIIDIITHPNDPNFPVDWNTLAELAVEKGVALELNNSKIRYRRATIDDTVAMLESFASAGALLTINSDTHALNELGDDSDVRPLVEMVGYPNELIVNRSVHATKEFLEQRRLLK